MFLGSPFKELALPPLADCSTANEFARVVLLHNWAELYDFIIDYYLPLLARAKRGERIVVFLDVFGLEGVTHATAHTNCMNIRKKVIHLHHMLVHEFFVLEGIEPPLYYRLRASREKVDSLMLTKSPHLAQVDPECRKRFVDHQEDIADGYFRKETVQKSHDLDAESFSLPKLARQVFDHTCERIVLHERSLSAAA